eukprot:Seg1487.4 transcript_id=Seg1487.4/GoldUCD/mRNA.D3Y31 product="hypothetical protein" protein_id=Seg1487.4/GoldUCD/D3Y31
MNASGKQRGRPKREEPKKKVYFTQLTFDLWNLKKSELSLTSDSFAKKLLHETNLPLVSSNDKETSSFKTPRTVRFNLDDHEYHSKSNLPQPTPSSITPATAFTTPVLHVLRPLESIIDDTFCDQEKSSPCISTPAASKKRRRQLLAFSPIEVDEDKDIAEKDQALEADNGEELTVTALDSTLRLLSINTEIGTLIGDPFNDSESDTSMASTNSSSHEITSDSGESSSDR